MKHIVVYLSLMLLLSSCFGDSQELIKAKQELGVIESQELAPGVEQSSDDIVLEAEGDPRILITQVSGTPLLELNDLDYSEFKKGYSKITGTTLGYVDKIQVDFSNVDSDFPNDSFTLQKFAPGGKEFEYNASSQFKVLDFGLNKYVFTAYSGNEKSVLELQVLVSENDDQFITKPQIKTLSDEMSQDTATYNSGATTVSKSSLELSDFPSSPEFGNIVELGGGKMTYSDLKGLEMKSVELTQIGCGKDETTQEYGVSEFLLSHLNTWFYWNTCRPLTGGDGLSFYVLQLSGQDSYVYNKYYLDFTHNLLGVYELQTGTGVTRENISDKNSEFATQNAQFTTTKTVDSLFSKIANQ